MADLFKGGMPLRRLVPSSSHSLHFISVLQTLFDTWDREVVHWCFSSLVSLFLVRRPHLGAGSVGIHPLQPVNKRCQLLLLAQWMGQC